MRRFILIFMVSILTLSAISAQDDMTIAYGDSYVAELTNTSPSFNLGFDGVAGDVIYIHVLDNVPVEFQLMAPNGGLLAQAENSMIRNLTLGIDGRYTIEFVRPDWSEDEGEIIVRLDRFVIESLNEEDGDSTRSYEGNLADAGALRQFDVDFNEGDLTTIIFFGANVALTIESPAGIPLLFEGVYNDPFIPLYRFPETGTYTFIVSTAEPGGTDIGLFVNKHDLNSINVNEPFTGPILEDIPAVVTFETPAGKMWDINVVLPPNGSPFLSVYQFEGREYWEAEIASDWGTGPNGQPRIRPFIPEADGIYYIAVWFDHWETENEAYDFELTVSPSTLLSIPNNSPIVGEISNETGIAQYAYQGTAGDSIRVTFSKLSDDGTLSLSIYSTEDEVITFTGRSANSSRFDIDLPLDGFYEFVIQNASYEFDSVLSYEILVEPLSE